ncbi:GDP-mannose 4,6-dehydratase [Thalassospira povalilytica]|nr:GDP-mannose 4,6-dehydratase [Thalassospira povalilytica]
MGMSKKKALVFGVSGQDGSLLARLLLAKGYEVHGTSRDAETSSFGSLDALAIKDKVHLHSTIPTDFRSVLQTVDRVSPDEIYNLAGQSSVGLSFHQPVETLESIATSTLNILEVIRFLGLSAKFYSAGSSECFGDTGERPADETTPFHPQSPYAVAKATAFWQVANYRESYNLFACTGVLFNHESPLRPSRFVTRKIAAGAAKIYKSGGGVLELGDLSVMRDWGWAPEYVEAMWAMLQLDRPEDFVIATGQVSRLQDFVAHVFSQLGMNWQDHVRVNENLLRPSEIRCGFGDASKARKLLNWSAKVTMPEIARRLVRAELSRLDGQQNCKGLGL